ncbi:hypothetical protein ACHAXA_011886, partial [Cyclostephanos tholiformis]
RRSSSMSLPRTASSLNSPRSSDMCITPRDDDHEGENDDDDDDDDDYDDDDEEEEEDDDRDPLLSLFRAHNTNRVKFNLGPSSSASPFGDGDDDVSAAIPAEDDDRNGIGSLSSPRLGLRRRCVPFLLKRTPRGATTRLLKTPTIVPRSPSTAVDVDDLDHPEMAIARQLLEPPTPIFRKIGSFLGDKLTASWVGGGGSDGSGSGSGHRDVGVGPLRRRRRRRLGSSSSDGGEVDVDIARLLGRAHVAHRGTFRYRVAMRYYLLALRRMAESGRYGNDHPLVVRAMRCLNDVHHAQSTLSNSADIVRMGMQHEDGDMLVRALRMYTIAHRMRRDVLGADHPSLCVLLNMMGSVQVKRGEYDEAMSLYELSLWGEEGVTEGVGRGGGGGRRRRNRGGEFGRHRNPLTTSVTLRDMGMISEHQGNVEKALRFYHASLRYALKYNSAKDDEGRREISSSSLCSSSKNGSCTQKDDDGAFGRRGARQKRTTSGPGSARDPTVDTLLWLDDVKDGDVAEPFSSMEVRMAKSSTAGQSSGGLTVANGDDDDRVAEDGEMELFLERKFDQWTLSSKEGDDGRLADVCDGSTKFFYDDVFLRTPPETADEKKIERENPRGDWKESDFDIAMILHQIGKIHQRSRRYPAALSAYKSSLRGLRKVLGTQHDIVAAVLGNLGNLYMETGDYDEALAMYQEVLGIETLQLGLSHPEVAVTLHNIATIECSRGNFADGVSLYMQVVDMQKIRYGNEHIAVAVTLSCLADAYEKLTNLNRAMKAYEEALKIRIALLGKSHLDVGRLMHKLGRLASSRNEYVLANAYMTRASEIYGINKLGPDHVFVCEMARDCADIRAQLAFAKK